MARAQSQARTAKILECSAASRLRALSTSPPDHDTCFPARTGFHRRSSLTSPAPWTRSCSAPEERREGRLVARRSVHGMDGLSRGRRVPPELVGSQMSADGSPNPVGSVRWRSSEQETPEVREGLPGSPARGAFQRELPRAAMNGHNLGSHAAHAPSRRAQGSPRAVRFDFEQNQYSACCKSRGE